MDIDRRAVYLPKTKNDEERKVPLAQEAITILKQARELNAGGEVFEMTEGAITQAMHDARRRAGIEDLYFHDLRHEATSRLFEDTDLDIMEIKTITGNRSLQMLARYRHLRTHRLAARLAGAQRGEPLEQKEETPKKRGRPRKQEIS